MKTEKRRILSVLLLTALVFAGCNKKEMKQETMKESTNHSMTQIYTYQGKTYQLHLLYDDKSTILEMTGDLEEIQKLKQKQSAEAAYLITQPNPDENTFTIEVFDDVLAMNNYQSKKGVPIPSHEKNCTDYNSVGGTAFYRFYEHANYVNELTYLTVSNQSYFQRDLYSAENDKISSLKIWGTTTGASVDIFENGCFSGITQRFGVSTPGQVMSIPNLTLFSFTVCGGYSRDIYGQIIFTPFYPCGNWNDKISSIKGWSI